MQTRDALARIEALAPALKFEAAPLETCGDRDRSTDLRQSPADFFTRELDCALLAGNIDCAVHSAKDIPYPVAPGLDWFWLPWREDPRDAIVLAPGRSLEDLPEHPVIGVSSGRREEYCRARFPGCVSQPIRGNIEERLALLDKSDFDMIIMAGAALLRLGLARRITEWLDLKRLPTPEGQGAIGVTFRAGDELMLGLRGLFVSAVVFAGAGAGGAGLCTVAGVQALERAQVCLYDSLMDESLLDRLPAGCIRIDAGKRCGAHCLEQEQTTELIAKYARQGLRVVRLKGGDPGIFGRLAEEIEALDALSLAYRVIPGISSLQSATTATGMLLTRRGGSRGFCVMTPRVKGGGVAPVNRDERVRLPVVFFMAVKLAGDIASELIAEGMDEAMPCAMVFNAGAEDQFILTAAAAAFAGRGSDAARVERELAKRDDQPGLFIAGEPAAHRFGVHGALGGMRVLLTCSAELQDKAAARVLDFGGIPVQRPMIRLVTCPEAAQVVGRVGDYDWLALTSPSAARCFAALFREANGDIRKLPRVMVCGGGTAGEMRKLLLVTPDIVPGAGFGAESLAAAARGELWRGERVLRLRSDKAGAALAGALRESGAAVEDVVMYRNEAMKYGTQPEFDAVFFASASAVEAYAENWGVESLAGKIVVAIGRPTAAALARFDRAADVVSAEATSEGAITALAGLTACRRIIGG